jgi:glycosyltransferase involved in cell wall biosynthesis
MPTFSVVIPTYGRPQFLRDAVESVLAQTIDDFEVIVVDDHSPVPVEPPRDRRVRVVRATRNGGPAAARNLGVAAASGEILTFLDDDDTWTPERLKHALSALERAPVGICWQSSSPGRILNGDVHATILDAMTPSLGATAVSREVWRPLDVSYRACEDVVWWLDTTAIASVATEPKRGLVVRVHHGGRSGYAEPERIAASLRMMQERNGYFDTHPAASSFRWKRIGLMYLKLGDNRSARRAFFRAVRSRPSGADIRHLIRSLRSTPEHAGERDH